MVQEAQTVLGKGISLICGQFVIPDCVVSALRNAAAVVIHFAYIELRNNMSLICCQLIAPEGFYMVRLDTTAVFIRET